MSKESTNNPDTSPKDFFSHYSEDHKDNRASADNKSKKEEDVLFHYNGEFSDVSEWIQHEEFRLKRKNEDSERKLRENNATKAFWFCVAWAIFIVITITLRGFGDDIGYTFTQAEFLFIIGSLTTGIFTFYLLVLKYLFDRNGKDK